MAIFFDSDDSFMIYRRFGYLHARTLLRLQDKLKELEDELDKRDDADNVDQDSTSQIRLMSRRADEADCEIIARENPAIQTRTQILDEIEQLLVRYSV